MRAILTACYKWPRSHLLLPWEPTAAGAERCSSVVDGLEVERERARAVGGVVSADPDEGIRLFVKHVLSVGRKADVSMCIAEGHKEE